MNKKIKGAIYGMAIGDALGAPVEFKARGTFEPVEDFQDGAFGGLLSSGDWTDDTSMGLCLAQSLIEKECFDPIDQMKKYFNWYNDGYMSVIDHCFDIGNATREALENFQANGKTDPFMGSTDPSYAGNGSLMRLCPIPIFYKDDIEMAGEYSAESSKTTHASEETVEACRVYGRMIAAAVNGILNVEDFQSKERFSLLSILLEDLEHKLPEKIKNIISGSFLEKTEDEISSSGYVINSMEAALWALANSKSFKEGVLKAVNLGNDSDTVGAIYGQLAGALYGIDKIPSIWVENISKPKLLDDTVNSLIGISKNLNIAELAHKERIEKFKKFYLKRFHRIPERTWWIETEKVLGGPFPGSVNSDRAKQKISNLLDLGVVAFVDLMEDLEFNHNSMQSYEPYCGVLEELAEEKGKVVTRKQFFIKDQYPPNNIEKMMEILNFINSFVDKGQLVYVHCAGGHGRTGTVAACWLMCRGLAGGYENALSIIEAMRKDDPYLSYRPSPETEAQDLFIKDWESRMKNMQDYSFSCEDLRKSQEKGIHIFENADVFNPVVFHHIEEKAILFGRYGQQHVPYVMPWVVCTKKDCKHSEFTGWGTSPKGVSYFKNGRPHGHCLAWYRTKWHGGYFSHQGNFHSVGKFENGKLLKKTVLGDTIDFHINGYSFKLPRSFNLFCIQKEPWNKLNVLNANALDIDYYYTESDEHFTLQNCTQRKAISFFYAKEFFKYLSINQKIIISKNLKSLVGQEIEKKEVWDDRDVITKKGPIQYPFINILNLSHPDSDYL